MLSVIKFCKTTLFYMAQELMLEFGILFRLNYYIKLKTLFNSESKKHKRNSFVIVNRQNASIGLFVSDRSFKFFKLQIGPLSFTLVSDRSFKFFK
jgi:hypothetical protein